jgi:hypothetical protein
MRENQPIQQKTHNDTTHRLTKSTPPYAQETKAATKGRMEGESSGTEGKRDIKEERPGRQQVGQRIKIKVVQRQKR